MKIRGLITLSSLVALMMVGCGSSADRTDVPNENKKVLVEPTISQATKIERANWDGVEPVLDNFFITNNADKLSFKVVDESIANHSVRAVDIFIDADNNANTGYKRNWLSQGNIGADYLIENDKLYSHSGDGWHWDFVANISQKEMNTNEIELEFDRDLANIGNSIKVVAGLMNTNWHTIKRTDGVEYSLSNAGDNGGTTTRDVIVDEDENSISITIKSPTISKRTYKTEQIFLSTDFDDRDGYKREGSDYLIEGDTLYRYVEDDMAMFPTGAWSWERVAKVARDIQGDTIRVTIDKNGGIGIYKDDLHIVSRLVDNRWHVMESYTQDYHLQFGRGEHSLEDQVRHLPVDHPYGDISSVKAISPNGNFAIVLHDEGNVLDNYADITVLTLNSSGDIVQYFISREQSDDNSDIRFIDNDTIEYTLDAELKRLNVRALVQ
jgi:hypothetical protein